LECSIAFNHFNLTKTISNGPIERVLRLIEPLEASLLKMTWRSELMNTFDKLNPDTLSQATRSHCLKMSACITHADRARHASEDAERERVVGGTGHVARYYRLLGFLLSSYFALNYFIRNNFFLPKFVIFFSL
jgi:hypothetical protein